MNDPHVIAAYKAELAKRAARDIDQAGRGLHIALQQCASNTVDIKTVQIMNICQAYLNNAMTVVLDVVAGDEIDSTQRPENTLIVDPGV